MPFALIVEDDTRLCRTIAQALHGLRGASVLEARTIAEARTLIDRTTVDLVACDVQLPDGSALDLLPLSSHDGKRVPAVLVSKNGHLARSIPLDAPLLVHPIEVATLRDVALVMLESGANPVLSTVADYLRLACRHRRSIQLDVSKDGEHVGSIVVRDGQAWTASDALGNGTDAFLRLLMMQHPTFACSMLGEAGERTLEGSCEELLEDSRRLIEERRTRGKPPRASAPELRAGGKALRVVQIPPKDAAPRPIAPAKTVRPRATAPAIRPPVVPAVQPSGTCEPGPAALAQAAAPRPVTTPGHARDDRAHVNAANTRADLDAAEFDRLYDAGIEAVIQKRYADALTLFARAQAIRSTPTLEANLQRLRMLGFT